MPPFRLAAVALCAAIVLTIPAGAVAVPVDPVRATLIDQAGHAFSFAGLRGAPVAVTFVATRCQDECPLVDAWFARIQRRLRARRLHASLLTITLDPRYDTPRVMAARARALGADPAVWRFASGRIASVEAILEAFRVHPQTDEHGIPDIHTTFVYVLNARGKLADLELPSGNLVDDTLDALAAHATAARL